MSWEVLEEPVQATGSQRTTLRKIFAWYKKHPEAFYLLDKEQAKQAIAALLGPQMPEDTDPKQE